MLTPEEIKQANEITGWNTPVNFNPNRDAIKQRQAEIDDIAKKASASQRKESRTFVEKIGDITGGKEIAQGLGQSLAMKKNSKLLDEQIQQKTDLQGQILKRIKEKKALGEDTSHLQKTLEDLNFDTEVTGDSAEKEFLNQNELTKKQVLGDATQLATTIASVGGVGKAAKFVGGAKTVGGGAARGALAGAIEGGATGAIQGGATAAQNDKSIGVGAIEGGVAGAAGGAILGAISGGVGTKIAKGKKIKLQKSVEAVNPDLSGKKLAKAYEDIGTGRRTAVKTNIFDDQGLSETEQTRNLGARLQNVLKSKDPIKNLNSIKPEFEKTESAIEGLLNNDPELQYTADKDTLFKNLSSASKSAPEEFRIGDSSKMYNSVFKFADKVAKKAEDSPAGLRAARISFDNQARIQYPSAFREGAIDTKTPAGSAIKKARDIFNEHLYDTLPQGNKLRELIAHEADLYRANEIIASKAAKLHGEKWLEAFMRRNPGLIKTVKGIALVGGGIYGLSKVKQVFADKEE